MLPEVLLGRPFQEDAGEFKGVPWNSPRTHSGLCPEVKMVLFSRSFVRKRLISLATTASVAATSFALAEDPTRTDHVRGTRPIQCVASRPDHSQKQPFPPENDDAKNRLMADITVKPTGDADRDLSQ